MGSRNLQIEAGLEVWFPDKVSNGTLFGWGLLQVDLYEALLVAGTTTVVIGLC